MAFIDMYTFKILSDDWKEKSSHVKPGGVKVMHNPASSGTGSFKSMIPTPQSQCVSLPIIKIPSEKYLRRYGWSIIPLPAGQAPSNL
jgi:hypothetical protein